ncbi:MAG: terminase large subunit [Rhizobiales bacterium]|nr:terminase large subunit [Hyphomicrobiales bacterium]NRB15033.1 terminase large subunit [Hyphomicrobiales bacterium]
MGNLNHKVFEVTDYAGDVFDYAVGVVNHKAGEQYGKFERLACQRFLDDLERQKLAVCAFYFDVDRFNDAANFIEKLPHVKAFKGSKKIKLHITQLFILANIFGFRLKEDSSIRRFSTVYIEVGRKNGKSTFAACIALYCMVCESELAPEIITAATTKDQAKIVLNLMKKMIEKTPSLRREFGFKVQAYDILCKYMDGEAKAISADGGTNDGWNPHCAIVDELHAHKNRDVLDVIESADGARTNPLLMMITTAGKNLIGVCFDERDILIKILTGVHDDYDHYFGIIYTVDKDDDTLLEKNWRKANPLLGVSVNVKSMRKAARAAKASGAKKANFDTKRMNVWRHSADVWLDMMAYNKCAVPNLMDNLNQHTESGGLVEIGVDLSEFNDITSIVIAWIDSIDQLCWIAYHFLPEMTINDTEHKNYHHYQKWYEAGQLNMMPGGRIDLREVKKFIVGLNLGVNILEVVFDSATGASATAAELEEDENITAIMMNKNAANISPAALDFEARIGEGSFLHDGDPVLRWMASNVFVDRRIGGSILPKKETANSQNKIDGIDAGLHASARLRVIKPEAPRETIGEII